jgi:hypothetical protein
VAKMDLTVEELIALQRSAVYVQRFEDWGTSRGQGKRSGGMVVGGMSAAPTGIKSYDDPKATVGPEAWETIKCLGGLAGQDEDLDLAVAAIQHGYTPEEALMLAFKYSVAP